MNFNFDHDSAQCDLFDRAITAALQAANPVLALQHHLHRQQHTLTIAQHPYDLRDRDIRLIVVGKGAIPMARAFVTILGDVIDSAIVITKYDHTGNTELPAHWQLIEAAHPVPDQNSQFAGDRVCQLLENCTEKTLIFAGISGGASALMVAPQAGISLSMIQVINEALLRSGAEIGEMNTVRSHLDRLKGGGLVELAQPAQVVGLILSDVVGDPLDVIASGLTNHPAAQNSLIGNNRQACEAVAQVFSTAGYAVEIVTTELTGEAQLRGREIATQIGQRPAGTVLIYGGETTVTMAAETRGKGGRNQELALAAAIALHQSQIPATILTLATDGTDGPTDAAGAWVDSSTVAQAIAQGLDAHLALEQHNSYPFFAQLGHLVIPGPTGTNVADVAIALKPLT